SCASIRAAPSSPIAPPVRVDGGRYAISGCLDLLRPLPIWWERVWQCRAESRGSPPSTTGSIGSRLAEVHPEIAKAPREAAERQNRNLELIASENFVSEAVLEAVGSVLTNKYAEGYPGRRYYGGCEIVDVVEDLAIARARELFGAAHANVQPHSGAQANMAVY